MPGADARGRACAPLNPAEPATYGDTEVYVALVPDRVRDVRVLGERDVRRVRDSGILVARPLGGLSWTDAKGTRYILRGSAALPAVRLPGCPAPDPLPQDALDRGMRAALSPSTASTPTRPRRASRAPGRARVTSHPARHRSAAAMIIGLRLTPRGAGGAHAARGPAARRARRRRRDRLREARPTQISRRGGRRAARARARDGRSAASRGCRSAWPNGRRGGRSRRDCGRSRAGRGADGERVGRRRLGRGVAVALLIQAQTR